MNTKEKIKVMQAWVDGKIIEILYERSPVETDIWAPVDAPNWDWVNNTYRIKPTPREFWLNLKSINYGDAWADEETANKAFYTGYKEQIKVKEVLDE